MFYGISWHHCVLNVPWRVQNCHPRFFVIGAHWPWYSICNYLCNNILLLWLWLQRPRAGERSIIADCTPGCCTSPHRQPQHANTSKLSNLLRNIQNIIKTVWCYQLQCGDKQWSYWYDQPKQLSTLIKFWDKITFPKSFDMIIFLPFNFQIKYMSSRKERIRNHERYDWTLTTCVGGARNVFGSPVHVGNIPLTPHSLKSNFIFTFPGKRLIQRIFSRSWACVPLCAHWWK